MAAVEPEPMSRGAAIAYAIGLPLGLLALVFLPAGTWRWTPGWIFVAFLVVAYGVAALILLKVNPAIYRARSRVQPGTRRWDRILLALMLPAMVAEIPLATLDAGRMGWSHVPDAVVVLGYVLLAAGIAFGAWPQAVNRFFEPGVRLQREREQTVITTGPYALVRHPGYLAALLTFAGIPLALASWWALLPAGWASAVLIVRTRWEDALLHAELQGYADYAARVRYRLVPGLW